MSFTQEDLQALWAVIWSAVKSSVVEAMSPLLERIDNLSSQKPVTSVSEETDISTEIELDNSELKEAYVIMKIADTTLNYSNYSMPLREQYPTWSKSFSSIDEATQYLEENVWKRYDKNVYKIQLRKI
jgi:hypothetical protein